MTKQCKCEHWQQCPVCMPHRFDADGNLKPPEPTPLQAAQANADYWEEEARRYASNADYWRKRCVSCGGALPATGQDDRTGECVCGEPTALNTVHRTDGPCYVAEPVQEPVALETVYETIIHWDDGGGKRSRRELARRIVDLYTAPPQRKPLSEDEIDSIWDSEKAFADIYAIARAVERAHGIDGAPEERNFCSRCGKRTNDIHTCTPPAPLTDEVIADLWHQNGGFHHHFARAIERWLRGHA